MLFTKNEIIEGNGFYVSYLPHSNSAFGMFSGDGGGAETALVKKNGDKRPVYLVLNGDFREQYKAALAGGYDACLRVYEAHKKSSRSTWSEDDKQVG
jgi:hypothetical protein